MCVGGTFVYPLPVTPAIPTAAVKYIGTHVGTCVYTVQMCIEYYDIHTLTRYTVTMPHYTMTYHMHACIMHARIHVHTYVHVYVCWSTPHYVGDIIKLTPTIKMSYTYGYTTYTYIAGSLDLLSLLRRSRFVSLTRSKCQHFCRGHGAAPLCSGARPRAVPENPIASRVIMRTHTYVHVSWMIDYRFQHSAQLTSYHV